MPPSNGRGSCGPTPASSSGGGAPRATRRPWSTTTCGPAGGSPSSWPETEGERHDSTWEVIAADPPRHLELRDADVDDDGRPNDGNAMTAMVITIDERDGGGAVMAIRTHFDSLAGMEQVLAMGIEEGMRMVLSQIDAVLAGTPA